MSTSLLIIALAQPLAATTAAADTHPAAAPSPAFHQVDVIIVNQHYTQSKTHDGTPVSKVRYYISFWSVHYLPTGSLTSMPVWEHRGWCRGQPLVHSDGGWACQVGDNTIVAPRVLFIASDYDFEYRNRSFGWGRSVTK